MRLSKLFLFSLFISTSVLAQDVKVVGTLDQVLKTPQKNSLSKSTKQHIKLMKMELSPSALSTLNKRAAAANKKPTHFITSSSTPSKASLGMNNVPVLNQGSHGSCVTFATTAAMDAALNKGDYISQVCQLQLGKYLENNGYLPSGWEGTFGRFSLAQMEQFGIVSKEKQRTIGCGGLTEYPASEAVDSESSMSLEQFHQLSETLMGENEEDNNATWTPILDVFQAFLERTNTDKTLNEVKASLNQGDRVTFAVLLLDFDLGLEGAVGKHNGSYDSWVFTPEIARDVYLRPMFGGHEMVITGYDDEAIAVDDQGRQHKGLLTLRNSWGDEVGDKGDFYMSYDYFKVFVLEADRIRALVNPDSSEA